MGIRFLCPHCEQRLNVKTAQAGGLGKCPHCHGSITVPKNSTIPSELEKRLHVRRGKQPVKRSEDSSIGLHEVDEQVTMDGMPAENRQTESIPKSKKERESPSPVGDDADASPAEVFMLDKPKLPATMGKIDPIAESPTRIWYFRSRELGERGPLKGKAMQKHLDQGDIRVGCIVWREDWNEWLPAERVFPTLAVSANKKPQKSRASRGFKEANYQTPVKPNPLSEVKQRQRKKNQIFAGAVLAGVVIIIVLLVVLLKLVSNNP